MKRLFSLIAVTTLALAACSDYAGNGMVMGPTLDPMLQGAADHVPGSNTSQHVVGVQLLTAAGVVPAQVRIIWHKHPGVVTNYNVQLYANSTCSDPAIFGGGNIAGTAHALTDHLYVDSDPDLAAGSYCTKVKSQAPGQPTGFRAFVSATFTVSEVQPNQPPTAGFTYTPTNPDEGEEVDFDGTADDPDGDPLTYEWRIDGVLVSTDLSFHHTFDDNGTYEVSFTADDGNGGTATEMQDVMVANVAPTATFNAADVDEGTDISLSLTDVYDPSNADVAAGFEYAFDCGDGGGYGAWGSASTASCPTTDDDVRTVGGKVRDKDGDENEYTQSVTVSNVAPTIQTFNVSSYGPLPITAAINVSGAFTDPGSGDTHTLTLMCGGGVASAQAAAFTTAPDGNYSGTCTYASAGIYTIVVTLYDDDGGYDEATSDFVIVYDPNGGFVTGGGWIDSPADACHLHAACVGLTGKANFGFVSKYQKGSSIPTGNTQFHFNAGNFQFQSTSYQWLVVAGAKAQYKGYGNVNGVAGYGFILTAIDGQVNGGGGVDKFRIKIWEVAGGMVVYDNQLGQDETGNASTALGGGSIVIHTGGKK